MLISGIFLSIPLKFLLLFNAKLEDIFVNRIDLSCHSTLISGYFIGVQ